MSTAIVAIDEFTTPVIVPDGDDFMNDAADVVQAFVQVLANRSAWAKSRVDRAVLNNDATRSVLTVPLEVNTVQVREPLLRTRKGPRDQPSFPFNPWKEVLQGKNVSEADNQRSSLYVGDGAQGLIGFAVNAQWREDISPGKWRQLDTSKASYFVYVNGDGELRYSKKPAAAADWTAWDTTTVCTISAPFVHATNVQADEIVYCDALVAATLSYPGPVAHTSPIKLSSFVGFVWYKTSGYLYFQDDISSSKNEAIASIAVPVGATINQIRVRHAQGTATPDRFSVMKRVNLTIGTIAVSEEFFAVPTTSITGDKVTTISPIAYTVAAGDEVFFRWKLVDDGSPTALSTNHILGIEVDWNESAVSYQ